MSRHLSICYVIRDGGGTAPVELTVAEKLRARGHRVRLFGPPEVTAHATASGFPLHPLAWPEGLTVPDLIPRMLAAAPGWAGNLQPQLRQADLLIADCAAFGALIAGRAADLPTVSLMPTVYIAEDPLFAQNPRLVAALNRIRTAAGLAPIGATADQLLDADRLLLLTSRAFELARVRPPVNVSYVGPQLPSARSDGELELPSGQEQLVLISLSTTEQGQIPTLQRILDAISALPVRALVTLGPVNQDQLRLPDRVRAARYVPHDRVLPHAALVITHAGHGTVASAFSAGVPLVCLPMGRDQPAVAERVVAHGLGLAISPDAAVATIRAAVQEVLADPSFRSAARRMAEQLEPTDQVVTEVESVLR